MQRFAQSRPTIHDVLVFVLLVTLGVVARVAFQHIPNFAPVAALALFAGYFFGHRTLAICVPLAIMLISDQLVDAGSYRLSLMFTVYGLLTLPVFLSTLAKRYFDANQVTKSRVFASIAGLFTCSLACSLLFFFGTNFAVWASSTWYEPTFAGLMKCYVSAIPFFRYTLAGDAMFATVLFGSYALLTSTSRVTNVAQLTSE